ncbi:hypothetical protein DPMN_067206 [Dreissena polymorpha]|uniref:Uncharacterized protein n=1 Tax=Dreissena polymorpha TaxID=45954 RepID=A0A9D3YUV6_DREPO|nr:hypothetical protein DPMN_067206 [Dreissena polymorpha]
MKHRGFPRVGNGAIHKVQYQFEVNQCRNEEIIVKRQFWVGLVMGPCIVEIDRIVIRDVQGNFGCAWSMWTGRPSIDRIVIRDVQYQFEVNRCRNEEVNAWSMWAGRPRAGNGAMHINRHRNEEINVKGNFGWAWSMWAGRPRVGNGPCIVEIDRIYQFEVNQCRNEEVNVK